MVEDMGDGPVVQLVVTRQANGAWKVALFSEKRCVETLAGIESRDQTLGVIEKHLKKLAAPCNLGRTVA